MPAEVGPKATPRGDELSQGEPLSERLGQLSRDQLQGALDRFNLGLLKDVRAARSGLFGQNAFVTTETERWVLRGAPHWPWQFAKERFFAEALQRETRAPVPWPYLVEESDELFGWGYALMPRLPGTSPWELRKHLGRNDLCEIGRAMGAGLAEFHCLSALDPGEYDPGEGAIRPERPFAQWVLRGLESWREKAREIPGALEPADHGFIERIVEKNRAALDEPLEPCCVHYDYSETNVLVVRTEGHWRLSGILDLMTCAFGDGEQDLSRVAASLSRPHSEAARAFLSAYRERRPLRPRYAERFRLYMLMDRLVLWEYGRRNGVWFPDETRFRDFAGGFVALDSLLGDTVSQVERRSAHCLCGGVRIEISGKVGPLVYCHCTMCQRASGTAFSANVNVRRRYWKLLDGTELIREFESSPGVFRAFCSSCGSPLYSRREADPEIFRIRLGLLNADPERRSLAHFWVGSRVPWFEITDELPRFEGGPESHEEEIAEKLRGP